MWRRSDKLWICRVTHKKASNNNAGFIGASFQPWPWNYGKNNFKFEAVIITVPLPLLLSICEQMNALVVCDPMPLICFSLTSLWLFLNLQTVPAATVRIVSFSHSREIPPNAPTFVTFRVFVFLSCCLHVRYPWWPSLASALGGRNKDVSSVSSLY